MKRLLTSALLAFAPLASAQNAALMPMPRLTFLDSNGVPLSGGYLYTCVAGTSCTPALPGRPAVNPLATYTDSSAGVANSNPIVLDAAGRANVWLGKNMYKIVVQDFNGVTQFSQDNVNAPALALTGSLAGANGAGLVIYTATGTGAVSRTVAAKLGDVVNAADFGAVCDGATDNATAFGKLATFVNASSTVYQINMPAGGVCNYSGGLALSNQFVLDLGGATLNYTGTGHAMDIGLTTLNATTAFNYPTFVIRNGTFTGGASMTQGLYFNAFVIQPRVLNVQFLNFGNTTAYGLYFAANNWDILIDQCRSFGTPGSIGANWIMVAGTGDFGQSRLRVTHAHGTQQSSSGGVGIYTTGFNSEISSSKIEGFTPNIQVAGGNSLGTVISNVYLEADKPSKGCIVYGDAAGNWNQYLHIRDTYCNVHNTDFSTGNAFLAPYNSSIGLQYADLRNNMVGVKTVGAAMVAQSTAAGQSGNVGYHNLNTTTGGLVDVLHTAGVLAWSGVGADEFDLTNPLDSSLYINLKAGKTANQFSGLQFLGFSGSTLGSFAMGSDGKVRLVAGSSTSTFDTGGGLTIPGGITAGTTSVFAATGTGTPAMFINGVTGQSSDLVTAAVPGVGNVFGVTATGAVKVSGSTGVTVTVTCTAGQHLTGITIVGGVVTATPGCS